MSLKEQQPQAQTMAFPSRVVVLNGAAAGRGAGNLVALLEQGKIVAQEHLPGRGASERFAPVMRQLLEKAGWQELSAEEKRTQLAVVAVVGPGSFTGLRASLALAAGLARGWNCPAIGVTLGDAIRATLQKDAQEATVTVLSLARRGRIFVDPPGQAPHAMQVADVTADLWSQVAGDAVAGEDALQELRAQLGVREQVGATEQDEKKIIPCSAPNALGILKAAQERSALCKPAHPLFIPLYIDPPEAKLPAGGLRPAPV